MKQKSTLLILLLLSSLIINAQVKLKLVQFSTGYSTPVGIENCGDSRLFIVEQEGKIFISNAAGTRNTKPYLDITDRVLFNDEQGLLGLAFDPDYSSNGLFYVSYINEQGNLQISRFKVKKDDSSVASKSSEKFILEIDQPFANDKGGCIHFGPDGYLYIGTGDGGGVGDPDNNAQNPMSLLGKMLRIDVHHGNPYKVPIDNPFVDSANYRHEIWALGLHNPWKWSFDALNGSMFIGDVGENSWEEIDLQLQGAGGHNYGWRCYEGKHPYNTSGCGTQSSYNAPAYNYSHSTSTGDCAVIGGYMYRGTQYDSLYGKYIFVDYCSGIFRLLYRKGGSSLVAKAFKGADSAYSSFGVDTNNELYVCNILNGTIYHVTDAAVPLQNGFTSGKIPGQNGLSFFPNPSNGNINISYTSAKAGQVVVRITNLLGEQVYSASKIVTEGVNTWNINLHITKGNYYLSVTTNAGDISTQSLRIE